MEIDINEFSAILREGADRLIGKKIVGVTSEGPNDIILTLDDGTTLDITGNVWGGACELDLEVIDKLK